MEAFLTIKQAKPTILLPSFPKGTRETIKYNLFYPNVFQHFPSPFFPLVCSVRLWRPLPYMVCRNAFYFGQVYWAMPTLFSPAVYCVYVLFAPPQAPPRDLGSKDVLESNVLHQVSQVLVHVRLLLLDERHLGHKVQTTLALLFLQLEGDTAHGALLDALHQVGHEAGNLVAHALGRHLRHLVHHALVGVEVHGQTRVVLLDDHTGRFLHGLGTDTLLWWRRKGGRGAEVSLMCVFAILYRDSCCFPESLCAPLYLCVSGEGDKPSSPHSHAPSHLHHPLPLLPFSKALTMINQICPATRRCSCYCVYVCRYGGE